MEENELQEKYKHIGTHVNTLRVSISSIIAGQHKRII